MHTQSISVDLDPMLFDLSVEDLDLVDCAPPEAFDALTRLAQRLFGVPVALISIVEEQKDRQFFLSQQGLQEPWASRRQTPLSHSFCQHVKRTGAPLRVVNARDHPLVKDNLAIRDLGVGAYLGVPIRNPGGAVLGALCVIEEEPRVWEARDLDALEDLARCVTDEVTLRASMASSRIRHARTLRYGALREAVMLAFLAPDIAIEERFSELLKMSCEALDFDAGLIARIDAGSFEVEFSYCRQGSDPGGVVNRLPESMAAFVMSGQRQITVHDVPGSPHRGRHALMGRAPGQYVGLPLIYDGTLYGVLELFGAHARSEPYSNEEQSIFGIISMFVCAHLGMLGRIRALQNSESNLMGYLIQAQHSGLSWRAGQADGVGDLERDGSNSA